MDRTHRLEENRLVYRVKTLLRNLEELKKRQRSSGRSGLQSYFSQSVSQWDATGSITNGTRNITITFTGDGTQSFPISTPYVDIFANGTDEAHRVPLDGTLLNTGGGNTARLIAVDSWSDQLISDDTTVLTDVNVTRWKMRLSVNGTVTYYIKAYVAGTSLGTVSVGVAP